MQRSMQPIDASFVSASTLAQVAIWIKRGVVFVLWGVTLYGSVACFDLDFFNLTSEQSLAFGVAYQAGLTVCQFAFRRRYFEPWYYVPLAMSVIPSIITYTPLVIDQVASPFVGVFGDDIGYAIGFIIISIVMIAVDMVPERIAVKG